MRTLKKEFWYVIAVVIGCIFTLLPLFHPGFFPMHDNEQVGRLYELDQVLKVGEIPPRIVPNLGFGYGYAFYNFYPPLVYYIAEIFHLLGFSYIVSIKLLIATGFFSAAIAMYFFARKYMHEIAAVVASIAYTYAPYHSVDVYVRGALPEFFTFMFIPALFLSFMLLSHTLRKKYILISGVLIALFILTHNLIAMMSGVFLGLYVLYECLITKDKKKFIAYVGISGLIGLGLSAYFWMPSFFEKKYTMIDLLTTELANYSQHFVYFRQFWNSPWGYGGSVFGLYDGLSFQIGKIHIIAVIIGILLIGIFHKKKEKWMTLLFYLGLFVLSVFLMTFHSKFIWDLIPAFWYIQFPWRFLVFAAFFGSFFVGVINNYVLNKQKLAGTIFSVILILLLIGMNKNYFVPEKYLTSVTDNDYIATNVLRWDTSKLAAEYTPKGIATRKTDINTTVVDINKDQVAKQSYAVVNGIMSVQELKNNPQEKIYNLSVTQPGTFRINTYYYPGWEVYLNNQKIRYNVNNRLRLLTFDVPDGTYTVRAVFTNTLIRLLGNYLTVFTALGLGSYICYIFITKSERKKQND